MRLQDTSTSVVVGGSTELDRSEVLLLDQLTAPLGPCPTCHEDGAFLTFWTPWRTVNVVICAVCGTQRWASPVGQTS
jgi:hypothetical protein